MTIYPHKNSKPIERFVYWVKERQQITDRKAINKFPLTTDPIFRTYRFCSVHREDDRVTRWIAKHWRHYDDQNVWHAMIVARFINWPPTLERCGYPEPWPKECKKFGKKLHWMETNGERIFTGAYIVSTNGATGSKVDHVLRLFNRAWDELHTDFHEIQTCAGAYNRLREVNGIGSFMAAQIAADLKYTKQLDGAIDWMDFVAPGPGSQRGLNRILGYGLPSQWNNKNFSMALHKLRKDAAELHRPIKDLHLQDLQNCLCEFDKYERVLNKQGKPRSLYMPSTDPLP